MMAYESRKRPDTPATFTTSDRTKRRSVARLSGRAVQDLRDLWSGIDLQLDVGNPNVALRNALLRSPPSDLGTNVLDELRRLGGQTSEGRLIRTVAAEGWGTRREVERTVKRLVRDGLVERIAVPMPDVPPPAERHALDQLRFEDWSDSTTGQPGFDLRLVERADLALKIVPLTREERWRRDDEALERSLHVVEGSETPPSRVYEAADNTRASGADRAYRALCKLSDRQAEILRRFFGQHHEGDETGIDAVRGLVGGDDEAARAALDDACAAYRAARDLSPSERALEAVYDAQLAHREGRS